MPDTTKPLESSIPKSPPKRKRRLRRWLTRGLMIVIGAAILAGFVYAWVPKPVRVDLGMARRGSLDLIVEADGKTRVRERFVVTSPIAGTLERVELEAGDVVKAGQPVAQLAPPDPAMLDERTRAAAEARVAAALAQQRQAQTAITRAKVARDQAIRETRRVQTLVQAGAVTGSERERVELAEQLAVADVRQAELALAAATAELASARAALGRDVRHTGDRIPVVAPVNGTVLRVARDSAGPIAPGSPILELGDPADLEAVVDVLSSDAAQILIGAAVSIEGWGGPPLTGRVRRVEPSAFTRISALGIEEQRVNVIVAIPKPPEKLGDGFRVEARIVTWHGDDILVAPASAVFREQGEWSVYVVEGGRARLQRIGVGHRGRLEVEITSGLAAGDTVIIHPGDRVKHGLRVAAR